MVRLDISPAWSHNCKIKHRLVLSIWRQNRTKHLIYLKFVKQTSNNKISPQPSPTAEIQISGSIHPKMQKHSSLSKLKSPIIWTWLSRAANWRTWRAPLWCRSRTWSICMRDWRRRVPSPGCTLRPPSWRGTLRKSRPAPSWRALKVMNLRNIL